MENVLCVYVFYKKFVFGCFMWLGILSSDDDVGNENVF